MPGVTAHLKVKAKPDDAERFSTAQGTMRHQPDYESFIVANPHSSVGFVKYPTYPVRQFTADPDIILIIEGRIYNKTNDQVDRELISLADDIRIDTSLPRSAIRQWINNSDGEYVVVMALPKNRRLLVFTDPLGCLPLYYFRDRDQLVIARECKFILQLTASHAYDPMGCSQHLWIGYPLGQRTLFRDVKRLPAATLIDACVRGHELVGCEPSSLVMLNFEQKSEDLYHRGRAVDVLVDQFVQACRLRGAPPGRGTNIVGLSGGHDSRAVLAGMVRADVSCIAVTGQNPRQAKQEVSGAQAVATALGVPWKPYRDAKVDLAVHEELVHIKDGLQYTGVSVGVPNAKRVASTWGSDVTYLTGDGGDKALPDLRPPHGVSSKGALMRELELLHGWEGISKELSTTMLGLPEDAMTAEVQTILDSYPETEHAQKAVHYSIYERGRKFIMEGEDRHRFFYWVTTPFFSFPVFQTCLSIPDNLKKNRRLIF